MLRADETKKNDLIYKEHLRDLIDRIHKIQYHYNQQLQRRKERHPVTEIFKNKAGSHGDDVTTLVAAANDATEKMFAHDRKSMDPYRGLSKNAVEAYIKEGKEEAAKEMLLRNQDPTCFDGYMLEMGKLLELLSKELLTGLYKDAYRKDGFPNGFRIENNKAIFYDEKVLDNLEEKIAKINSRPNDDHYLRLIYGLLKEVNEQFPLSQYGRALFSYGNQFAYAGVVALLDGAQIEKSDTKRVVATMDTGNYENVAIKNNHKGERMPTWTEMAEMESSRVRQVSKSSP